MGLICVVLVETHGYETGGNLGENKQQKRSKESFHFALGCAASKIENKEIAFLTKLWEKGKLGRKGGKNGQKRWKEGSYILSSILPRSVTQAKWITKRLRF